MIFFVPKEKEVVMDEFVVIKVMNEAMLRLKKSKNEDFTKNEKIK